MNYVLIEADEGNTSRVLAVSGTQEDLVELIRKTFEDEIAEDALRSEDSKGYMRAVENALIAMVMKQQWPVGVHELETIEPQ